jgi:hypothetical protein
MALLALVVYVDLACDVLLGDEVYLLHWQKALGQVPGQLLETQ